MRVRMTDAGGNDADQDLIGSRRVHLCLAKTNGPALASIAATRTFVVALPSGHGGEPEPER